MAVRVRQPGGAPAGDEGVKIQGSQRHLGRRAHLGDLGIHIVDLKGDMAQGARRGGAVLVRRRGGAIDREQFQPRFGGFQEDDLLAAADGQAARDSKAEMVAVEIDRRAKIGAVQGEDLSRGRRSGGARASRSGVTCSAARRPFRAKQKQWEGLV